VRAFAGIVVLLAACRGSHPSVPSAPPPIVEATVLGPTGPVAGADVRLVELTPLPCPCGPVPLEYDDFGLPSCACPAALSIYRDRLAHCGLATPVERITSDARGRVRFARPPGVSAIEAGGSGGLAWQAWPRSGGPISVPLAATYQPQITLRGPDPTTVRAAVVFDDGHCIPVVRSGEAWTPQAPLPNIYDAIGTLVVEANGFATVVRALYLEKVELDLEPAVPAAGTCDGTHVRLDNPFQHLVGTVDTQKQFSIPGAIDVESEVVCRDGAGASVGEWDFTPGNGLTDPVTISGACIDVRVVDSSGTPVEGATVSWSPPDADEDNSGSSTPTDRRGVACLDELEAGGTIEVTAPSELGGACAGTTRIEITEQLLSMDPIVRRLIRQKVFGLAMRGHVRAPDGMPIAGADVSAAADGCADASVTVKTAPDGSFVLPNVPRGKVTLGAKHPWFLSAELATSNDGGVHDITLAPGTHWTGRVLDPEGQPLASCRASLELVSGRTIYGTCEHGTFTFVTLQPGPAKLWFRFTDTSLGASRDFTTSVEVAATNMTDDVRYPPGETIRGRLVDAQGQPIPDADLQASLRGQKITDVKTDAHGHFEFRHLPHGTWTLQAFGRFFTDHVIDVASGTTDVTYTVAAHD
jgi:protocatechuate 3,4-dioxygenase beta subunit